MGKKKFIDKKRAVTFQLQPADVAAMRAEPPPREPRRAKRTDDNDDDDDDDADLAATYNRAEWELAELGLPDDGYDYLQHVRDAGSAFVTSLPAAASAASVFFVPENSIVYKRGVDAVDEHRMSVAAAAVRVHDVARLDEATQLKVDIDAAGVIVADAALGADDLEILQALEQLDDEHQEELGDDFFLLANDGFVGGPTLTTERLTGLTDAQRAARDDARRELGLGGGDDDDDFDEDDEFYDDDFDDDDDDGDDDGVALTEVGTNFTSDTSLSKRERRARSDYYAQSIAESGKYERSEAGKTMRSEALQHLDQHFDEFEKQYDDDEIGDLEEQADDIMGMKELESVLDELNATRKKAHELIPLDAGFKDDEEKALIRRETLRLALQIMARPQHEDMADGPRDSRGRPIVNAKPKLENWDAESYTSLFSNTEFHPTVIAPPPRNGAAKARKPVSAADAVEAADRHVRFKLTKSGVPLAGIPVRGEAHKDGAAAPAAPAAADEEKPVDTLHTRPADETKEQKAARKSAVKAARAEARARKKVSRVTERASSKQQARANAHLGPQTAIQL